MNTEIELLEIVSKYFSEKNLNLEKWQNVLNNTNNNPSNFHLLSKVKYYVSCFSKYNAINLSLILYENSRAVGIMPLMAHKNIKNKWVLTSNGIEIVEPIFNKDLGNSSRKKFEKKILNMIIDLSKKLKINKCKFVNMEYFKLSEWYTGLLGLAEETFTTYHLLVNLSLSIEQIRSSFRKRFKSSINQGFREWKIQVHEKISQEKFDDCRLLHRRVAKKTTRPIESWNIQKQEIDAGLSFMVTASDLKDKIVGAGLFNCSTKIGYYESGAYQRELFDKPLAHPIQMKAIETLKKKGFNWYEIGQKYLRIDKISPTEKELSISHFKEGFATNVIARQHLSVNIFKLF